MLTAGDFLLASRKLSRECIQLVLADLHASLRSCLAEAKFLLDLLGVSGAVFQVLLELGQPLLALLQPFAALGLQLLMRIDLVLATLQLGP